MSKCTEQKTDDEYSYCCLSLTAGPPSWIRNTSKTGNDNFRAFFWADLCGEFWLKYWKWYAGRKKEKKKSSIFSPRPLIPSGLWPGLVDCGQDLLCLQVIFIYISSTPVLVKKLDEISIIADKSKERRQACFLRILFSSSDILRIGIGIESLFNSSVDSKPPQPKTCHTMRLFVQIVPKY